MSVRLLSVGLDLEGQQLAVGRLALNERRVLFEYDRSFIDRGLPLSPIGLPLADGVRESPTAPFGGLFGLFADSLPDSYGRLLLDRLWRQRGRDPTILTAIDRLAMVGGRGLGALTYAPAEGDEAPLSGAIDLDALQAEALAVIGGEPSDLLPLLQRLGGSAGGARPKALIWLSPDRSRLSIGTAPPADADAGAWIVKFRSPVDPPDLGPVEYAYAGMADAAGVEVTEHHLFAAADGGGFFATRRFDVAPSGRLHFHSLAGLLQAEPMSAAVSYLELLKATQFLTRDIREAERAFRRMAFNVFAHNRDDHAQNHGFLMNSSGEWRLAPAYDLTFSQGPGGEHYLSVATEGRRPRRTDMLEVARQAGLTIKTCEMILDEVAEAVMRWPSFADEAGLSRARTAEIGAHFVPGGAA